MAPSTSIFLKKYHCQDGREIHYSAARLRKDPACSPTGTAIIDIEVDGENDSSTKDCACWVLFYPAGPNRRMLELVVSRFAPKFSSYDHGGKDILFLCANRPGKGGTSMPLEDEVTDEKATEVADSDGQSSSAQVSKSSISPEQRHIAAACRDVATILDHYGISRTSIMYMCAGSTFAFSFSSKFSERTTGNIIGLSSWILPFSTENSSPGRIHASLHQKAINGRFGPRWMVSSIVGGMMGFSNGLIGIAPTAWVTKAFLKDLSEDEKKEFDTRYPNGGVEFVDLLLWAHGDADGEGSVLVNADIPSERRGSASSDAINNSFCGITGNINNQRSHGDYQKGDGNAKDIAVCLSPQDVLGIDYKTMMPPQKNVCLWHGERDNMIFVAGSEWLASMIPNSTLTIVPNGTHQGTMLFCPEGVLDALNKLSEVR